jgi:hypothetical protein
MALINLIIVFFSFCPRYECVHLRNQDIELIEERAVSGIVCGWAVNGMTQDSINGTVSAVGQTCAMSASNQMTALSGKWTFQKILPINAIFDHSSKVIEMQSIPTTFRIIATIMMSFHRDIVIEMVNCIIVIDQLLIHLIQILS